MRNLDHQVAIVEAFRQRGTVVTLCIMSAEVPTLTDDDVADLRAFGLTDAMLDALIDMAREPGKLFELDFARQTVTVYTGYFG